MISSPGLYRSAAVSLVALLGWTAASAAAPTRGAIDGWLAKYRAATHDSVAAGRYGQAALAELQPFLPPGFYEEFDFPEVDIEIGQTTAQPPHPDYQAATARFAGTVSLGLDGELVGYQAGRPFSSAQIAAAPPEQAGLMVVWNHVKRWQFYGYEVEEIKMAYVEPGAGGMRMEGMNGGGAIMRTIDMNYHRVYLNQLAMLPDSGYSAAVDDAAGLHYKDFMELTAPFDVTGTKFIIERSLAPDEEDQVNSYLPTERRVRRVSAKERADSFLGSQFTLDDFEAFSGRVYDYNWTYLGRRAVLHVSDSRNELAEFIGPRSHLPHDRWQVRDCHVIEARPKWSGHPYASRVMFVDAETGSVVLALVSNDQGEIWKLFYTMYRRPPGALSISAWLASIGVDRLSQQSTVARSSGTEFPDMKPSKIRRRFSVSNLTSGR